MRIKQDPVTGLWCREDGAVLMPPSGTKFKTFRWTFGSKDPTGYRKVRYRGKLHKVHQLVCRAFHGLPPVPKLDIDHINRRKDDNRPCNLRWATRKENVDNTNRVDRSIEKYGVRFCDDKKAYNKAYGGAHREDKKAYHTTYYEAHRAEQKVYGKAHYEAHHEEIRARQKAYDEVHREERKAYREAHREEIRAYMKAYHERRKGGGA